MSTKVRHSARYGSLMRLPEAFTDWSEFDAEAEHWGTEVHGLSRKELPALIEGSTRKIPTTEHRRLH
jgi:hypothetical protein